MTFLAIHAGWFCQNWLIRFRLSFGCNSPQPYLLNFVHAAMQYRLEHDGFAIVPGLVPPDLRQALLSALGSMEGAGRRGLLSVPNIRSFANSATILNLVTPPLDSVPIPIRAIFFDKSQASNWLVAWHQDVTIALKREVDVAGFGPWSVKDGIPHVQPPVDLLTQMLAVRVHLDDADNSNGALRVIPGSHRFGRLSAEQITQLRGQSQEFTCCVSAGDVLLMRPLLLHASSKSSSTRRRRILHIEYCAAELPGGLEWHEAA